MRYEIDGQILTDIADSIREKTGKDALIKAEDMAGEIDGIGDGIMTGTTLPLSAMGNDGDMYIQTFPLANNVNYVEFLSADGSQYIDSGLKGNEKTRLYVKGLAANDDIALIGAQQNYYRNALLIQFISNRILVRVGTSVSSSGANADTNSIQSTQTVTLNTPFEAMVESPFYISTVFETPVNIVLFGNNQNGNIAKGKCALYRVKIFVNGVPMRDYIPCIDVHGTACMWDNISGEYVYNDGTGEFAYGTSTTPDPLEPLLYVKKNGVWEVVSQ